MGLGRQNRDFFGTFLALWSHLGPSPKFGTLSERLRIAAAYLRWLLWTLYKSPTSREEIQSPLSQLLACNGELGLGILNTSPQDLLHLGSISFRQVEKYTFDQALSPRRHFDHSSDFSLPVKVESWGIVRLVRDLRKYKF